MSIDRVLLEPKMKISEPIPIKLFPNVEIMPNYTIRQTKEYLKTYCAVDSLGDTLYVKRNGNNQTTYAVKFNRDAIILVRRIIDAKGLRANKIIFEVEIDKNSDEGNYRMFVNVDRKSKKIQHTVKRESGQMSRCSICEKTVYENEKYITIHNKEDIVTMHNKCKRRAASKDLENIRIVARLEDSIQELEFRIRKSNGTISYPGKECLKNLREVLSKVPNGGSK